MQNSNNTEATVEAGECLRESFWLFHVTDIISAHTYSISNVQLLFEIKKQLFKYVLQ